MRRLLPLLVLAAPLAALAPTAHAQAVGTCATGTATADLSVAGVRARLFNTGGLFWKGAGAVYNVPKAADGQRVTPNAIFAAGLWVGGYVGAELRSVAATYANWELWPGPLAPGGALVNPNCAAYDRIYRVTRADVDAYRQTGALVADLRDWPAALGAPVVDGDGVAGNYNLAGGDRPEILGSETAWWVMNDVGAVKRTTATKPIGLEVQVTAFAMTSEDGAISRSTLYRYRLVNRNALPLTGAYVGIFTDSDLGNATDDYVGSDSARSLAYTYNADNNDEGTDGYGVGPPALGLRVLGGPLVSAPGQTWTDPDGTAYPDQRRLGLGGALYFDNNTSNHGSPRGGTSDFYNYLRGVWKNEAPVRACGNGDDTARPDCPVTRFMYPGDPITKQGWSEVNIFPGIGSPGANAPNDRNFVSTVGPFTLPAGGAQTLTVAYVYGRGGTNLGSVTALRAASDRVQQAWDSGAFLRGSDGSAPDVITAAPVPLAPADGATGQPTPVRLVWEGLAGSVNYVVQVGHDPAFGSDATRTETVASASFAFAPDSTGRPYHWRVRGISTSAAGAAGPWSQASSFTSTPRTVQAPSFELGFLTTANAAGPLAPPEPAAFAFAGFPVPASPNGARQQTTGGLTATQGWNLFTFGASTTYAQWLGRVTRDGANNAEAYASDFEWRFTGTSKAQRAYEDQAVVVVPFELWSLGADVASSSDDVRMIPSICEEGCTAGAAQGTFDIGGDSPLSGGANDPVSDGVYWNYPVNRTPGQAGYLAYANGTSGGVDATQVGAEAWARMALVGVNFGAAGAAYPLAIPEPGTVFQIRRSARPGTAPALASPASGARLPGTTVAFRWAGADLNGSYEFQIARDAAFTDLVRSDLVSGDVYVSAHVVPDLAAGPVMHWRVRARPVSPAGPPPPWSEAWTFVAGTATAADGTDLAQGLALGLVRPNPARGDARVRVAMPPSGGAARVEVFDVLGRRVAVAHDGALAPGWTDVALGSSGWPVGMYVVRLTSGGETRTQTLVVTR